LNTEKQTVEQLNNEIILLQETVCLVLSLVPNAHILQDDQKVNQLQKDLDFKSAQLLQTENNLKLQEQDNLSKQEMLKSRATELEQMACLLHKRQQENSDKDQEISKLQQQVTNIKVDRNRAVEKLQQRIEELEEREQILEQRIEVSNQITSEQLSQDFNPGISDEEDESPSQEERKLQIQKLESELVSIFVELKKVKYSKRN
jgi:hypothetical protein